MTDFHMSTAPILVEELQPKQHQKYNTGPSRHQGRPYLYADLKKNML